MRNLNELNPYRVSLMGDMGDEKNGAFQMRICGDIYQIIASNGEGWEHVSISHKSKLPTWEVMARLKDLFFKENEVVMQLHPKKEDYVNMHPNCLHLWKPIDQEIPTPPKWLVGMN